MVKSYYPIAFECELAVCVGRRKPKRHSKNTQARRHARGQRFNQVVMNVFAYDVTWKKDERLLAEHEYGSPRVFPFGGENDSPDHSKINIHYFKRLDRVIEYLDQKES